ncbi:MAG: HAD family hydrolase [Promethearchaeota archaeon]
MGALKIVDAFRNKKAIVLDLDGTILRLKVKWDDLREKLSQRCLDNYGEKRVFKRVTEYLDIVVVKKDNQELKRVFELIKDYELKNIEDVELIEETHYFLNNYEVFGVKKKTLFAVLSLNMKETIKRSLAKVGILEKFDFLIGREDVRNWKPSPEGLTKIKNHYGLKSEEMIFIGDLQSDVLTGKNAGIESYLVDELVSVVHLSWNKK